MDFYNQSDNKPLRWQQLQQTALLGMTETDSDSIISKAKACKVDVIDVSIIPNFFIHWQVGKVEKYVEWQPDWHLKTRYHGTMPFIDICYINDELDKFTFMDNDNEISIINAVFSDCLWHYGKIAENPTHTEIDAQDGT